MYVIWCKFLIRENTDEIDEFLVICQNFPYQIFLLNQARAAHAWFLKLLWFARRYACMCLSVCPPPRPLITSGVIWCDIGRVRLVK